MKNTKKKKFSNKSNDTRNARGYDVSDRKDSGKTRVYESKSYPKSDGGNDPMWYLHDGAITSSVSNINIDIPSGTYINAESSRGFNLVELGYSDAGVCGINWIPYIASIANVDGPLNVAAQKAFIKIRENKSAYANYDPADLMIYLIAASQLYSLYALVARNYKLIKSYNVNNKYMPQAIMNAIGMDWNDWYSNMSKIRPWLLTFAAKMENIKIPTSFDVLTRYVWLNSGLFCDEEGQKSQVYAFSQNRYYSFIIDPDSGLGALANSSLGTNLTFSTLTTKIETAYNNLMAQQDSWAIASDIQQHFDSSNIFALAIPAENDTIVPLYDELVLLQIHNLDMVNFDTYGTITQSANGTLIDSSIIAATNREHNVTPYGLKVLDFFHDQVTAAEVLEATRLSPILKLYANPDDPTTPLTEIISCGTDLIIGVRFVYTTNTGNTTIDVTNHSNYNFMSRFNGLYKRYDPTEVVPNAVGDPSKYKATNIVWETHNHAVVEDYALMNINRSALLSLLDVTTK